VLSLFYFISSSLRITNRVRFAFFGVKKRKLSYLLSILSNNQSFVIKKVKIIQILTYFKKICVQWLHMQPIFPSRVLFYFVFYFRKFKELYFIFYFIFKDLNSAYFILFSILRNYLGYFSYFLFSRININLQLLTMKMNFNEKFHVSFAIIMIL